MKYAIISDCYLPRFEDYKDFHILISDLSKEQVLGLIKAHKESVEISILQNIHPMKIHVKADGFEEPFSEFSGDFLYDLSVGKIVPMWDFNSFTENK